MLYEIDARDMIVSVDGEWSRFAAANDGPDADAEVVLGRSLWDFVSGFAVRDLYRSLVRRVRGGHPVSFEFRCDGPAERRLLRMEMRAAGGGNVGFHSEIVRVEEREPVNVHPAIFSGRALPAERFIAVCSWCKRIRLPKAHWVEVEEAVVKLQLFREPPRLTHGICGACYERVSESIGA